MSMVLMEAESAGRTMLYDETAEGQWFVLRTKSRQEKILATELAHAGVGHFLPLMNVVRVYGGRKLRVDVPVFPGYLFLRGTPEQAYFADRTRRVAQVISVADQRTINGELQNLAFALEQNAPLSVCPDLRVGTRVEVTAGPFTGLRGVVEDPARCDRVVLRVGTLGTAVMLEIEAAFVTPLDD